MDAWGPAAAGVAVLGLAASTAVPTDVVDDRREDARPTVVSRADRDELVTKVGAALQVRFSDWLDGGPVPVDGDGDFELRHERDVLWVRVRQDQPAVEIFTFLVGEVRSRRQAAIEISILNRDHPWVRWTLRDRIVWLGALVPGRSWVPATFDTMLDHVLAAVARSRDDLQLRLGGSPGR